MRAALGGRRLRDTDVNSNDISRAMERRYGIKLVVRNIPR